MTVIEQMQKAAIGMVAGSAKRLEASYESPFQAHATMEPCNATVHLTADRLDVWMGSQSALGNARLAIS